MLLPIAFLGTHYLDFMPALATKRGVKRYLEIGVNCGDMLARMPVEKCIGVDPEFVLTQNVAGGKRDLLLVQETSDDFFNNKNRMKCFFGEKIQMSFLDGMHLFEYLLRDFFNAEAESGADAIIVMHDCLPLDNNMINRSQSEANNLTIRADKNVGFWTGDVWKIIPILKKHRPDLQLDYIDCHPTGLVCATNLNPSSRVLRENYDNIVREAIEWPNDEKGLADLYGSIEITPASAVV